MEALMVHILIAIENSGLHRVSHVFQKMDLCYSILFRLDLFARLALVIREYLGYDKNKIYKETILCLSDTDTFIYSVYAEYASINIKVLIQDSLFLVQFSTRVFDFRL